LIEIKRALFERNIPVCLFFATPPADAHYCLIAIGGIVVTSDFETVSR
jgi:hypothetical protein